MAVKDRANDPKRVPKIKVEGAAGPRAKKFNGGKNRDKFVQDYISGRVDQIGAGGTWTTKEADTSGIIKNSTGTTGKIRRLGSANNG
jgi:hypothetical protein